MRLTDKKILTVVDDIFEDLELMYPILRLREEGATVTVAGKEAGYTYKGKNGVPAQSDVSFSEVKVEEYDALLIPGGFAPDKLRRYPEVIEFVQHFDQKEKVIGHICHAGWVLVSADVLKGVKVTSTPAIKDDLVNAGAEWVDQEVVVDGHIISSRKPDDLPAYVKTIADHLAG
ncbi:type 1 glutamine amidotransferase domain-containing protein [Amphibacillus sp. Q70]|uniref:type 1 glutamine amidotransferase domain-containing protein n=1 Tax=Amphibacillus sp. Q70 TaxID=3453416 RepID=UPI003F875E4E